MLLVCFAVFLLNRKAESPPPLEEALEYQFPVMNTVAQFKLYGPPMDVGKAFESAREAIIKVEKTCSIFDPKSEISRLNASAADSPFKCSPLLWEILEHSRRFHRISGGSIDITVKPLMSLWGFHKKRGELPAQKDIEEALKTVGLEKAEFDDAKQTVKFNVKGMGFDLGGVAKGFALGKASEKVLSQGINRGMIKLGGNIRCLPAAPPGRDSYKIGIQSPFDKEEICGVASVIDSSIGTSGDYENYVVIEGRHYTHIMNPKTGRPVENMLSATIVTPQEIDSDALSKALFVDGPKAAQELCERIPRTQALIIRLDPADSTKIIVEKFGSVWGEINLREPQASSEEKTKNAAR